LAHSLDFLVEQKFGFNTMFIMETVLAILALFFCLLVNGQKIAFHFTEKHPKISVQDFIEPKALPIASTIFIVGLGYAAIQAYLSFYSTELNLATYSSIFFLVYAFAILISRPFTGKIVDRFGENAVIIPSAIINMLGLCLLAITSSGWMMLVSAFLIGLGFGNFQSTCQTVAARSVPIERLSQATATYFILFDLSLGVGPYALGIVEPFTGYRGLFWLMGIMVIIGLAWYLLIHGRGSKTADTDLPSETVDKELD
jgi:Arabinose efflux permease